jgi:hypothetical protein
MDKYLHRILGFYATRTEAETVAGELLHLGLSPDQLRILEPGQGAGGEGRADSDDVLKEMLVDGSIGTGVGALAGAAGTVALGLASVSLFIASPVLAALVMLGWGASLGGVVGALVGAQGSKGEVSDLVKDALANGHVVLVVHARSEAQTTLAQQTIGQSMPPPEPLVVAATRADAPLQA